MISAGKDYARGRKPSEVVIPSQADSEERQSQRYIFTKDRMSDRQSMNQQSNAHHPPKNILLQQYKHNNDDDDDDEEEEEESEESE